MSVAIFGQFFSTSSIAFAVPSVRFGPILFARSVFVGPEPASFAQIRGLKQQRFRPDGLLDFFPHSQRDIITTSSYHISIRSFPHNIAAIFIHIVEAIFAAISAHHAPTVFSEPHTVNIFSSHIISLQLFIASGPLPHKMSSLPQVDALPAQSAKGTPPAPPPTPRSSSRAPLPPAPPPTPRSSSRAPDELRGGGAAHHRRAVRQISETTTRTTAAQFVKGTATGHVRNKESTDTNQKGAGKPGNNKEKAANKGKGEAANGSGTTSVASDVDVAALASKFMNDGFFAVGNFQRHHNWSFYDDFQRHHNAENLQRHQYNKEKAANKGKGEAANGTTSVASDVDVAALYSKFMHDGFFAVGNLQRHEKKSYKKLRK